jgi:rRNA-processing protein FCF1
VGKARPPTIVLDAGALIAFERGDARMRALLREALAKDATLLVPAGVLGQVWRNAAKQVAIRAVLDEPTTRVIALDRATAEAAGILCGRSRTADVIDATVVLAARRARAPVITSDAGDLRRLDPDLELHEV